jgi:hypothetical protein
MAAEERDAVAKFHCDRRSMRVIEPNGEIPTSGSLAVVKTK